MISGALDMIQYRNSPFGFVSVDFIFSQNNLFVLNL